MTTPDLTALANAARKGETSAMKQLFHLAEQGYPGALQQMHDLAKEGDLVTQYHLGIIYACGQDGLQDLTKAWAWLHIVASSVSSDHASVAESKGESIENWSRFVTSINPSGCEQAKGIRDDLEQRMTFDQVTEAQALARQYIKIIQEKQC